MTHTWTHKQAHTESRPRSKSSKHPHKPTHRNERPRSQSCDKCTATPVPLRKRSISASNLDCVNDHRFVANKSSNIGDVLDCKSKDEYLDDLCEDGHGESLNVFKGFELFKIWSEVLQQISWGQKFPEEKNARPFLERKSKSFNP